MPEGTRARVGRPPCAIGCPDPAAGTVVGARSPRPSPSETRRSRGIERAELGLLLDGPEELDDEVDRAVEVVEAADLDLRVHVPIRDADADRRAAAADDLDRLRVVAGQLAARQQLMGDVAPPRGL